MASINGIMLKNIKIKNKAIIARVDLDKKPVATVSFRIVNRQLQFVSLNTHYYSDKNLLKGFDDIEDVFNDDTVNAIKLDESNENELNKRILSYLNNNDSNDYLSNFKDVDSFFLKLFLLHEQETNECKSEKTGNIDRTNYNINTYTKGN